LESLLQIPFEHAAGTGDFRQRYFPVKEKRVPNYSCAKSPFDQDILVIRPLFLFPSKRKSATIRARFEFTVLEDFDSGGILYEPC